MFDIERNFRLYKLEDLLEIVDIGVVKIEIGIMKIIEEFLELVKLSV